MPTTKRVDSELKKVLTLYGERAWDNSLEDDLVARGYSSMNSYINALARKITIHSVNYSTGLMPESADPKRKLEHLLWLFATILYSVNWIWYRSMGRMVGLVNLSGRMKRAFACHCSNVSSTLMKSQMPSCICVSAYFHGTE
jgi:hypothetical protein